MSKRASGYTLGLFAFGLAINAAWDFIKVSAGWLWQGLLAVASFGPQSVRDQMYVSAARLTRAELGNDLHASASAFVVALSAAAILYVVRLPDMSFRARVSRVLPLLFIEVAIVTASGTVRVHFMREVATYREEFFAIAAGNLTGDDARRLDANRLAVHDRASFLEYMDSLRAIAESSGYKMPIAPMF